MSNADAYTNMDLILLNKILKDDVITAYDAENVVIM